MKNHFIKISFVLLLVLTLLSCSKDDEFLTSGEKTALEINNIISTRGITAFSILEYQTYAYQYEDWIPIIEGNNENSMIAGSFFKVQDQYFNLDKLEKFSVTGTLMRLYFR